MFPGRRLAVAHTEEEKFRDAVFESKILTKIYDFLNVQGARKFKRTGFSDGLG